MYVKQLQELRPLLCVSMLLGGRGVGWLLMEVLQASPAAL